ncbi:MAG: hypothetical protein AB1403_07610 [Candidatus Riflebacteria bacterium]
MIKGPTVSELIHHIKQCPEEFLRPPVFKGKGEIFTLALVNDTWRKLLGEPTSIHGITIGADQRSVAELALMQICCWAIDHSFFRQTGPDWFKKFICEALTPIAPLVKTELWVKDEERAEELARLLLQACGALPKGETEAEAQDRLAAVDTIKRLKVIEESRAAMERAREIKRKMAEAKAREAANVYSRE